MNIAIFDTETTSLDKPFCYNIGVVIANVETGDILSQKDFVVEQVWHNKMCFASAYYAEKRPLYIKAMRAKETKMEKFGYICHLYQGHTARPRAGDQYIRHGRTERT